jgi:hypothetical protein
MKKAYLVLTFDYELPLGSCRDYNKGLFEPTEKILGIAKETGVPIVLFADICCARMFQQWDYDHFYTPFKAQLQEAIKSNHDVQLHIHPHWLTSTFKDGDFIPSRNYILSTFRKMNYPNNIEGIVENSVKLLTEICRESDPGYHCVAYRGGGYNLHPDTSRILGSLYMYGVRIDSSIIKKYYFKTDIKEEDYRHMPFQANWFISLHGELNKMAESGIFEVPVTSMPPFIWQRFRRIAKKIIFKDKYKKLKYNHSGTGFIGKADSFKSKVLNAINSPFVLSFDNLTTDIAQIDAIINYTLIKNKNEEDIVLCANSHPKGFGEYQLSLLHNSIKHIKNKYSGLIEFTTFQEINKIKGLSNM